MGRTGGFALQVLQAFRQPAELTLNGACTDSSAGRKPPTDFWRGARRAYIDAAKAAAIALLSEK